jgi:hypothetical protein
MFFKLNILKYSFKESVKRLISHIKREPFPRRVQRYQHPWVRRKKR